LLALATDYKNEVLRRGLLDQTEQIDMGHRVALLFSSVLTVSSSEYILRLNWPRIAPSILWWALTCVESKSELKLTALLLQFVELALRSGQPWAIRFPNQRSKIMPPSFPIRPLLHFKENDGIGGPTALTRTQSPHWGPFCLSHSQV
jgi:hypothetical protein